MKRLFKIGSDRHDVGNVLFSWHPDGNFIASAGGNGIIQITDRSGGIVDEIPMSTSAPILKLEWDKDGEHLAILQEGNNIVPLYNLATKRVIPLETGFADPSFLCWSKTGPQLAVGTNKGNLLIYNKQSKKKNSVMGKHAKKIVCGSWSNEGNKLALGSADCTITVSNDSGDTLVHSELKNPPIETSFCNRSATRERQQNQESQDNTISANLGGKSILLLNFLNDKEDPMELTFSTNSSGMCRYGDLVHYEWYNDNMLVIGFSLGWVIVVSTDISAIGEEKFSLQVHASKLTNLAYNPFLKRVATAVGDGIRVVDARDFKELKNDFISLENVENGKIRQIGWSPDGQILSVATQSGNIYNFLAKISTLYASHKNSLCYLSSLRELSVVNTKRKARPVEISLLLEPTVVAIGPLHVGAGMNNKVYFHRISGNNSASDIVNEQEYVSTVKEVQLNKSFAAVLMDNKVVLHSIETGASDQQSKTFPLRDEGAFSKVTCIALTDEFLYYGTEGGAVEVFFIAEWAMLPGAELRLDNAVKRLYPNGNGTRLVVVNSLNQIYLYNPVTGGGVNQSITLFENTPSVFTHVMWDASEKNVVMVSDGRFIHTYMYVPYSIKGPMVTKLGPLEISAEGGIVMKPDKVEIPVGQSMVTSDSGVVTCQTITGSVASFTHPYFSNLPDNRKDGTSETPSVSARLNTAGYVSRYCQSLALLRLEDAWQAALELDKREFWLALSGKSLELLNIELAIRVYRQLGDAGMVMSLQKCKHVEDRYLLGGYIALLFSDYPRAQELFLMSSKPIAALDMQCDLMYWDQALKLANNIAITRVPQISIKYAQQMEFKEETDKSLRLFESALNAIDNDGLGCCPDHLVPVAMAGIARCNLRLGNVRQGIRLANEVDSAVLFGECGEILEQLKQYSDSAALYIKANLLEKAAEIYTQYILKSEKNRIPEAALILEKVKSCHLNSAFGKSCEAVGRYQEAAAAYERAKDICKVVELKLRHLDAVQEAFDLVRDTASSDAAVIVANYCLEISNFRGAIEFLLMAKKSDEAFKLAQAQSHVDVYASLLGDAIGGEDALRVATYYEKAQDFGKAGKYYSICMQYQRALKLFIQCGDREIDAAIDVVGKSQNEHLTHQLIDFLVGEKDGIPKDPNYIYRLYMALRKYDDAAKTALIIARQEQDMGNYALAHGVVFETIQRLEADSIRVPSQLRAQFVLLHSYIIVRRVVKSGNHNGAAHLLLRVAENISKFPQHLVQILTSTVVECQRSGMKAASYEYAVLLMRPEHRTTIAADLRRKIEAIVRKKSANMENVPVELTPCPISSQLIPAYELTCPDTKDAIPMCIVTGRHMVLNDWCFCPVSKFPALYSEYVKYIESDQKASLQKELDENPPQEYKGGDYPDSPVRGRSVPPTVDPILGQPVTIDDLEQATPDEIKKYILRYNNQKEEPPPADKTSVGGAGGDAQAAAGGSGKAGKGGGDAKQLQSSNSQDSASPLKEAKPSW